MPTLNAYKQLSLAVLISCGSIASVQANSIEALKLFNKNVKTFQADFSQKVYNESGEKQSESSGELQVDRPGMFRWDYKKPYEQLIVANGEKVWIFDIDLQQVNIKPYEQAMANAPGSLFDGKRPLDEEFELRDLGESDDIKWVELIPKNEAAEFSAIYVGLDDKGPALMDLRDKLGLSTQIEFQNLKTNISLKKDHFNFTPPEGVDVIGK